MAARDFVHLHVHSDNSLLDGAARCDQLARKAKEAGMHSVALTDHGVLYGAVSFYKACKKQGIRPILGCEAYIAPGPRSVKSHKRGELSNYHLVLLARNNQGYKNLGKLISAAHLDGFYRKPRIDKELLREFGDGLIGLSSCLRGEVNHWLLKDDIERAREVAKEYTSILGEGNFFLEIQENGLDMQTKVNKGLLQLAKEVGIPPVATGDVHYVEKPDYLVQDMLLCIGTGKTRDNPDRWRMETRDLYFHGIEEMHQKFSYCPDALQTSLDIAARCEVELDFKSRHLPVFSPPKKKTEKVAPEPLKYFIDLVWEGARERYGDPVPEEAKARTQYEIEVIQRLGFESYFLIVWDFIRFAREQGIPVGPGRGSAAGSIVAYNLRITDVDPLEYDLLFERFLNAERISMPDIDVDFCNDGREQVIQYVREKYGEKCVAQIITFGTLAARGVLRDVGRALDIPLSTVDRLAKLVPPDPKMTLAKAFDREPELQKEYESDVKLRELFDFARKLEGLKRHTGTHACGVVIGSQELSNLVPLARSKGEIVTQFTMDVLEEIGLLKMDFLGLRTLTVIHNAVRNIEANRGTKIDIGSIALDGGETADRTYEMLMRGDSIGVFQFESSGFRDIISRLKPDRFTDLIALVALYRPGPLGSGMVDTYIECKHGRQAIEYSHPILEPILSETNGVILYQEQVMRIANKMAGFSMNQADSLRKAMGKKKVELMAKFRGKFVEGAQANGVPEKVASGTWELMEFFAGYGFNKSHSAAYALIAYRTAWLKANYQIEYMASLISSEFQNTDKVVDYLAECEKHGLEILPPHVNSSGRNFTPQGDKTIHYGLSAIKGLGLKAIESINQARKESPFSSIFDFCERVDLHSCNKGGMESLIKSGCFDNMGANRKQLLAVLENAMKQGQSVQKDKAAGQMTFFDTFDEKSDAEVSYPDVEEFSERERLQFEKETLGFYMSSHPLKEHNDLVSKYSTHTTRELKGLPMDTQVVMGVLIQSMRRHLDKNGNTMAFLNLEDMHGHCEAVVFSRTFKEVGELLVEDAILFIAGKVDTNREDPSVKIDTIMKPEQVSGTVATHLTLRLDEGKVGPKTLDRVHEILGHHPGKLALFFNVRLENGSTCRIRSSSYSVEPSDGLTAALVGVLGPGTVQFGGMRRQLVEAGPERGFRRSRG